MRHSTSPFITRAAGLLFSGLALVACDPKILLGEFGDSEGPQSTGGGDGTEGQSSSNGGTEGQSSGGSQGSSEGGSSEGGSSEGGSSESDSGGETTGETTGTTGGGNECSVWHQDCPWGQKCTPAGNDGPSWNEWRCVDLDPNPQPVGDSCHVVGGPTSGEDDCEIGAVCWDADPVTGEGTCVALCGGTPQSPSCAAGHHCAVLNEGILNICLANCDPLLQNCEGTDACLPLEDEFVCVLDASGAEGQAFDPCEFLNACDPGLFCADPALASECSQTEAGCCLPFCVLDDPDFCPGVDQVCIPWYAPMTAPPGFEDVGVCGLEP
ncbi:hypothetical protein [Nannocystis bainbridge]|uniref:Uncharacterized protein n=1 Tax=Nannocystis bainbridge TaxID=2995303 RepID=A0ABT5DSW1_9BACT|nr:hypothetical protein [Nannocystis bainbridge]MDC0716708.1 hypothetical protein [Nannocystis bainbridge]